MTIFSTRLALIEYSPRLFHIFFVLLAQTYLQVLEPSEPDKTLRTFDVS